MLTEKQIIEILENKKDTKLFSKEERKQIFAFAFGEEFIESKDKGTLKKYKGAN